MYTFANFEKNIACNFVELSPVDENENKESTTCAPQTTGVTTLTKSTVATSLPTSSTPASKTTVGGTGGEVTSTTSAVATTSSVLPAAVLPSSITEKSRIMSGSEDVVKLQKSASASALTLLVHSSGKPVPKKHHFMLYPYQEENIYLMFYITFYHFQVY